MSGCWLVGKLNKQVSAQSVKDESRLNTRWCQQGRHIQVQKRHQDLCNSETCSAGFSFYLVCRRFLHPERLLWRDSEADSARQLALPCSAMTWCSWHSWETSETQKTVSIVVVWVVENQLPTIIEMRLSSKTCAQHLESQHFQMPAHCLTGTRGPKRLRIHPSLKQLKGRSRHWGSWLPSMIPSWCNWQH